MIHPVTPNNQTWQDPTPEGVSKDKGTRMPRNNKAKQTLIETPLGKRDRSFDSMDESYLLTTKFHAWNRAKEQLQAFMTNLSGRSALELGMGMPSRNRAYILGRPVRRDLKHRTLSRSDQEGRH